MILRQNVSVSTYSYSYKAGTIKLNIRANSLPIIVNMGCFGHSELYVIQRLGETQKYHGYLHPNRENRNCQAKTVLDRQYNKFFDTHD